MKNLFLLHELQHRAQKVYECGVKKVVSDTKASKKPLLKLARLTSHGKTPAPRCYTYMYIFIQKQHIALLGLKEIHQFKGKKLRQAKRGWMFLATGRENRE